MSDKIKEQLIADSKNGDKIVTLDHTRHNEYRVIISAKNNPDDHVIYRYNRYNEACNDFDSIIYMAKVGGAK